MCEFRKGEVRFRLPEKLSIIYYCTYQQVVFESESASVIAIAKVIPIVMTVFLAKYDICIRKILREWPITDASIWKSPCLHVMQQCPPFSSWYELYNPAALPLVKMLYHVVETQVGSSDISGQENAAGRCCARNCDAGS